uniref:Retrovirus-related Pol polyprotein from transposon TNT 1-94-like beta-barrel domain-containing protein n=1 Tax=Amphimedon queenslandica TaxID=400682 RepID=A0A1X7UC74_AMPQE
MKAITEIFNELSVIGDNIEVEDKVVCLLASLPESFNMLVIVLEASPEAPEMGTVVERLLHEERKLKEKDLKSGEGAFMAKQKKKGPRCHFCKRFGHIQRNCFERQKGQNQGKGKPQQTRVNATDVKGESESEIGLIVKHALSAGANREPRTNWIIDSGATSHICNDSSYFVKIKRLKKSIDVTLGDGHILKAEGRGTVILLNRAMGQTRKCKLHNVLYVPKLTYNLLSISRAVERYLVCIQ